jgi:hypothetical protein
VDIMRDGRAPLDYETVSAGAPEDEIPGLDT